MASPHQRQFVWQLNEALRRLPASTLPGLRDDRSSLGFQMKCESWGYCSQLELVKWLPTWPL